MSVSGNVARRAPYEPLIAEWGHIAPCFCYHCPVEKNFPPMRTRMRPTISKFIFLSTKPEKAAAFIFRAGRRCHSRCRSAARRLRRAPSRKSCGKNGILLIADEVMTGMGRTGKPFAAQHWNIEPDMILVGKESPAVTPRLGAVLVPPASSRHSNGAPAPSCTASLISLILFARPQATPFSDYLESHKLFDRVVPAGNNLRDALSLLQSHPNVGDVRGLGLLFGVEFVKDKTTHEPFSREQQHRRENSPGLSR